jgi:hypothetical protein
MDVLGYDLVTVPEPGGVLALGFVMGGVVRWRKSARESRRA